MRRSPSSQQIHQKYIYMWNNAYRTLTECCQKTSDFTKGKKLPVYLGCAKEKRKNRDKIIGTRPAPLGGRELWRRKSFLTLGSTFTCGDRRWWRGKLQSHRGENSNSGAEGKAERFPHRVSVPASTHQPERLVCSPATQDGCGLGSEAQAMEVRSQGEDWGWLHEHSLNRASAPQLARRESRKKSGPA